MTGQDVLLLVAVLAVVVLAARVVLTLAMRLRWLLLAAGLLWLATQYGFSIF